MKKTRSKQSKVALRRGFVKRLQSVRGKRSQAQFARDLNVFQQNINRYEHGTLPHVDFLITLARAENVSVDWLLLGRGSRNLR
jgi:transcriptional regulator with XRE-family HTH domain